MDRWVRVFVVAAEIIIIRGRDRAVTPQNLSLILSHHYTGKVEIRCEKTQLTAKLEMRPLGWFGMYVHTVYATIRHSVTCCYCDALL